MDSPQITGHCFDCSHLVRYPTTPDAISMAQRGYFGCDLTNGGVFFNERAVCVLIPSRFEPLPEEPRNDP